jgi:hypothetical protein
MPPCRAPELSYLSGVSFSGCRGESGSLGARHEWSDLSYRLDRRDSVHPLGAWPALTAIKNGYAMTSVYPGPGRKNGCVVGFAKPRCTLDDNVKHRLELGWRGANDPQNLSHRRLLLERLGKPLF